MVYEHAHLEALLPCRIPYFFNYKTEFCFPIQNNPKSLDLSYKINLDLWDCLGRVNLVANFQRTDLVICNYSLMESVGLGGPR